MECWKWVHPVGERDPLLQLSTTPVIQRFPVDFCEFQLRHLEPYSLNAVIKNKDFCEWSDGVME